MVGEDLAEVIEVAVVVCVEGEAELPAGTLRERFGGIGDVLPDDRQDVMNSVLKTLEKDRNRRYAPPGSLPRCRPSEGDQLSGCPARTHLTW